jgi:hypothetical protein
MHIRKILSAFVMCAVLVPAIAFGQSGLYTAPKETIDRIRDEGLNRSQVMPTLMYMTDVIGPRLTGSPGMKRANEWTRDTLAKWGLQNAHLEQWGPFGRGWTLKRAYAMVDGPTAFPLIAYPKAWSPGTDSLLPPSPAPDPKNKNKGAAAAPRTTAFTGEVVKFWANNEAELEQFKGKLKGKIVLVGAMRELKAQMEAPGKRLTDAELLALADAPDPATVRPANQFAQFQQQAQFAARRFRFLHEEGAAILIDTSFRGDGGTVFVQGATAVQPADQTPGQPQVNVRTKEPSCPFSSQSRPSTLTASRA